MKHRMCTEKDCTAPPHVENCETCFGWGVYPSSGPPKGEKPGVLIPIAAHDIEHPPENWQRCPECGGTPNGIVKEGKSP